MNSFVFVMMLNAILLVFVIGFFFFNQGVARFLLFRPSLLFFVGLLIVVLGVILSTIFSDIQASVLDDLIKKKYNDVNVLNLFENYAGGLAAQVKVYDYVLIPMGAGFIVSAIFMRLTLLLKEIDCQHNIKYSEINLKKEKLKSEHEKLKYYSDNGVSGEKINEINKSIEYLDEIIYDAEILFEKKFGFGDFKYYKEIG